jgi:hypothetical protein
MTKEERQQMLDNQKMIDEMNGSKVTDSNTEVHDKIVLATDAFAAAEEEQKRKELLQKKISG